jgi:hypothetical protein
MDTRGLPFLLSFSERRVRVQSPEYERPAESLTLEDFHARPAFRESAAREAFDTSRTDVSHETTDDE